MIPKGLLANDQRPLIAGGSEARIDLVEIPLAQPDLHEIEQSLRHPGEEYAVRDSTLFPARGLFVSGAAVDEEQIQIGVISQLLSAQFPHGDHHQSLGGRSASRLPVARQLFG